MLCRFARVIEIRKKYRQENHGSLQRRGAAFFNKGLIEPPLGYHGRAVIFVKFSIHIPRCPRQDEAQRVKRCLLRLFGHLVFLPVFGTMMSAGKAGSVTRRAP